jgi:hypothetical protein
MMLGMDFREPFKCENCGGAVTYFFTNAFPDRCRCGYPIPLTATADLPDFNLRALRELRWQQYFGEIATELEPIVLAFRSNVGLVVSQVSLLEWTAAAGAGYSELIRDSFAEVVGSRRSPEFNDLSRTSEVAAEAARRIEARVPPSRLIVTGELAEKLAVDDLVAWRGTKLTGLAIHSLLSSMIVGTWTAFETVATDAWRVAVNQRPKSLGKMVLSAPNVPDLNLDLLVRNGFDLGKTLGDVLWSERKRFGLDFNSLDGLVDLYGKAFSVESKGGGRHRHPEMRKWFSGDRYNEIEVLEAYRHVLVHRAGQVDPSFVWRAKKFVGADAELANLQLNDHVPLDGIRVSRLVDATVARATTLLRGVSEWLNQEELT